MAVQSSIGNLWQVKHVRTQSQRFCAIKFIFEGHSLLLISVYLPTDYHNTCTQLMRNTLGELGGFIATDYLMISGDWNTDWSHL